MLKDSLKLYFDSVEEHRDWYLVQYTPPNPGYSLATLILTIIEPVSPEKIAKTMEAECIRWHNRYPIPLMVLSSNADESPTNVNSVRKDDVVIGYSKGNAEQLLMHWGKLGDEEFPHNTYSNGELQRIYFDIPKKNSIQVAHQVRTRFLQHRKIKLYIWLTTLVVPLTWLFFEEFISPDWFAWTIAVYGAYKIVSSYLQNTGRIPKSVTAAEDESRRIRERHFVYHCSRNPKGFNKLMMENLEQDIAKLHSQREAHLRKKKTEDHPV